MLKRELLKSIYHRDTEKNEMNTASTQPQGFVEVSVERASGRIKVHNV